MTPAEAERLLGGHAAGILTPEERRALYAAALKDQALFDALADEEALRALLADPAARAHLLALLAPAEPAPSVAPARPLWRRPSVLGLAASLFLLVTTRAVLRRTDAPLALHEQQRSQASAAPPAKPAPEAKADAEKATPDVQALGPARRDRLASQLLERQAPAAPPPPPPPMSASLSTPAGAPSPIAMQDAAPPAQEPALAKRQKQEAEAKDQVAKASAEAKAAAPAREAIGVLGGVPGGVVGGAPAVSIGGASAAENLDASRAPATAQFFTAKQRAQAPTWTLTDLGQGRRRVRVRHGEGHLYLLQRSGDRVTLLKPLATEATGASRTTDFEATLAPGDALDLYLLPTPAPKPETLPATGALAGFRARIQP